MNKPVALLSIFLGVLVAHQARGDVTVTEPTGANSLSADTSANSTNGAAYSPLGDIVITEGAAADFASGTGLTFILTLPAGWRFNPTGASVVFLNSRDITAASLAVTASNLTVTFSVGGTTKLDQLTIHGLQVQPLDGAADPNAGYILNLSSSGGTATIAGIHPDLTTFGLLNTIPGTPRALGFAAQPSPSAVAGVSFAQQPDVMTYDQFGNQCYLDMTTVVTASRSAGTGTLFGTTNLTAVGGECSFTDLNYTVAETMTIRFAGTNLTSVTSAPVVVTPATASRLVFTTQPGSAAAGAPFGIQPALKSQDQFGNDSAVGLPASQLVTMTLNSGTGTLSGGTNQDIGSSAGNGVVSYTNLQIDAAGNGKQLTASSSGFTSALSSLFNVSGNGFSGLLVVAPGETLAPGTVSGKVGTPLSQKTGTAFNVTVYAVDANYNQVNNVTDVVSIASSDSSATLPGNKPLVGGTNSFSVALNTLGSATVTASDVTNPSKTPSTSSAIPVTSSPARLTLQTQPSATATGGAVFSQQPIVRVEDGSGNLISSDNGRVITATRGTGTAALQGTLTATTVNGVATFSTLSYNVAETITIVFSATGLTNATSDSVVVSPAAADRLIFATQPGGVSRVGSPLATQPVIKTRDPYGNLSTVGLPASLPLSLGLGAGSGSLSGTTTFDIGTAAGNGIATCTNLQCSTAGTNKQLSATATGLSTGLSAAFSVGGVDPAFGGSAISADTASGTYTTLTGPVYYESASGDAGAGTVILNAPAGFSFDTGGTAPTVIITRIGGSGGNSNNVDKVASGTAVAVTSRATNQVTLTVTNASSSGVACSLTWTNLRVRPNAGTPLADGALTKGGTATMAAVIASNTSIATLTEVAGAATRLAFTTQPGSGRAGALLTTQPVVYSRDQFGNNSTAGLPASKILSLALSTGTGPLLGTTNADIGTAAGNGVATFTNVEIDSAGTNKQLTASASAMTNVVSSTFTVATGPASRLTIQTQPSATATAGASFAQQPIIRIEDAYGNLRSSDNTTVVTASRAAGTASLQGTISQTAVNGLVTFTNLSYNVAETITLSFASAGLTGATSANVAVSAGAASRLTISTQPSATASAGVAFAQQPVIRIEDQFGNLRSSDNSTVVTAMRSAGSGALQGTTNKTAVGGIVTFTNLSHNVATNITIQFTSGTLTSATSSSISVGVATASRLTVQTQPSSVATAGMVFAQQPVVRVEDAFGNLIGSDSSTVVTATRAGGAGTLQGTLTAMASSGLASFTNLSHLVATNITIQFSGGTLASAASSTVTVSAAAASRLTIQTQPPGSTTAGATFSPQPQIRVEDQFGNLRTSDNTTVVSAARNLGSASLQGTTSVTASSGVATFANLNYTVAETMNMSFSSGSLVGATSSNVVVSAAAASKLTILTQPSNVATAGVVFAQQPVVRIEDLYGNLRSGDSSTVVTAARGIGTGALQGTTTATASGGFATFSNLSYRVAETMNIVFSSGSLTSATSGNVVVSAGPFAKLQLLVPGETAAPGTASGKTGTPAAQNAFTGFNITVNAVDAYWNRVSAVTDTVGITSSDVTATLPANTPLTAGTQVSTVFFNTNGSFILTTTDLTDGSKTANTSPAITVNAAQFTQATGGSGISADTTSGTFTALTGPTYSENASGNVSTGTIILNSPSGFIFDTGGTAPTMLITRLTGSGSTANNINGTSSGTAVAMTSVSTTQLVFTVTSASSGVTCKLTWQSVRVRPTAGAPLARGNLKITGTASVVGVSTNANIGTLIEVAGAPSVLAIQTQPSAAATAGQVFAQQPAIQIRDRFGNLRSAANGSADNSTVVTAARSGGSGTLQGTTSLTAVNGVVTFSNLSHNVATNITILFSSGSLTNVSSTTIAISPAAASSLAFTTQPGNATAGSAFGAQPVVKSQDIFGNNSTVGLPASLSVNVSLISGTGPLQGSASLDIGAAAGNGTGSFTNLRIDAAGASKQLTAIASGLTSAVSGTFSVAPGAATHLVTQTQPPVSATAGVVFSPATVVALQDQFNNLVSTDNATVVSAARNQGTASLQGTTSVTVSGGLATFSNLSYNTAETMTINFSSGSLAGTISSNVVVSAAAANRLTIATQPPATAIAGVAFAPQPVIRIEDVYGNLRSGDNSTVVSAARSAGSGTLQGTTSLTAVNGLVSFTNLSHTVATNITIAFSSGSLTSATSGTIAVSPAPASRLTILTQPSASATAGVVLAQQPKLRIEDAFGNLIASDNSTVVTAIRNAGSGTLQGTLTATASNGIASFTNLSHNVATNITIDFASSGLSGATSASVAVSPAAADHLTIQSQPSATATAGVIFVQQPVIRIEDVFGNLRSSDSSTVVTAARAAGSGTLQGTLTMTTANGVATFTNLSHNVATNITIQFASGTLVSATSGTIAVSPAAASRLTILTQPSATATAGSAFAQQPVVRIEDAFGNLRSADNSTVVMAARAAGSGTLQGTTAQTAVNGLVSYTDLFHNVATNITIVFSSGSLSNATSASIAVSASGADHLTVITQPSASATAGAVFAQQPRVRLEDAFGNLISTDNSTVVTVTRSAGSAALQGTTALAASGGVVTFTNLSYNVAETITLGFGSGSLTGVTSSNVVVSAAAASRLTIQQQPASSATAGALFAPQPVVRIEDQFGNLRSSDNTTVVTVSRLAGSGILQGTTNLTAVNGVVTFTNLSHLVATNITLSFNSGSLTGAVSSQIAISPALANRLVFATQPSSATAGAPFGVQPAIKTQDPFGNDSTVGMGSSVNVTMTLSAGTGPLQGTTTLDIGTNAGNGWVSFSGLEIDSAGTNKQLTANAVGFSNAVSSVFAVTPAAGDHLTLLTQPSSSVIAGAVFAQQPVVRIEDIFGNLCSSDNSTMVTASRAAGSAALQGTTALRAVNGVISFTNLSYTMAETMNIGLSSGSLGGTVSSNVVVSAAAANRLTIATQPPATAIAGALFAPQPVVRVEDAYGNLRSGDNSTAVSAARSAGSGTLQGTTNLTAVNGLVAFTNLSHTVATNITIAFSSGTLTSATSGTIAVSPAAGSRLTILTQPSASATAGVAFALQPKLRIEDAFGNLIASDNSTVVTASRNAGSGSLQGTTSLPAVSGLVAFTNLSHNVATNITIAFAGSGLSGVTSASIAVSQAAADHLTLQSQLPATATAGVVFAQQPVIRIEDAFGNLRSSDSSTVVTAARAAGSGTLQGTLTATAVNGVATFVNLSHNVATNITIQFTGGSLASATSSTIAVGAAAATRLMLLTQPSATATAGVAFAQQPVIRIEDTFGNLRSGDNSTVVSAARAAGSGVLQGTTVLTAINGLVAYTNLSHNLATNITVQFTSGSLSNTISGTIVVSAGAADHLAIQTQPSSTATAGVVFAQQPKVRLEDAFGNLISSDSSMVVTAGRSEGSGTLQGTLNATAVNGVASFTNLSHLVANTITIGFNSGSLTGAVSSNVVISPTTATGLGFTVQPGVAVAGTVFGVQPVVRSQDQYGNNSTVGLTSNRMVSVSLTTGTGPLQGTTNLIIGTNGGNGVVSFTNLRIDVVGTKQLTASSTGFTSTVSSPFTVSSAPASRLTIQTQPSSAATAGVAFAQQPVVRVEDSLGNLISSDNSTVVTATRTGGAGALQGTVTATASNGLATFTNLSHLVATNITIQFSSGSLATVTSSNVTISPAAASRLTVLTQPSASATAGAVFSPQPQVRIEDQFGNLRTSDNSTVVSAVRNLGSVSLQGTISATATGGVASFTNLSYTVAETMNVGFSSGSLAGTISSNVVVSAAAANRLTIATQPPATAIAGVAFAPQPVIRIEDVYGNLRSGDNSTVVSAARSAGSGTLQGTTSLTAVNGLVSFTNLSHTVATNITIAFSSGSLTSATSGTIAVSPAPASRLTILTQPSASATAGVVLAQQPKLRIEDAFGNLIASDNSTVVTAIRNAGSGTLQGTLTATASNGIASFTNLSHNVATNITIDFASSGLSGATSASVAVSPAAADHLTIQSQPSATATAGVIFVQQPVIRIEDVFGNLRSSDSSTVVTAARAAGSGTLQGTLTMTTANGVATFTNLSHNVATNITIQFASGTLVSATSGTIAVSPAAASRLTILTQPSATATAGSAFAQQPVVRIEDAFGNLRSADNSTVVMAARAAGSGTLQGTTAQTAVNGLVSYTDLFHNVATNITIVFSSGSLSNATSASIAVSASGADHLTVITQPSASATAGAVFAQQPRVRLEDAFGNLISTDNSTVVTVTRSAGSAALQGTTALAASGGVVTFTNLSYNVAETITLGFGSGSLTGVTSSNVVVSAAAASRLTIQQQPASSATAGALFAPQPVVRIEDQFGNLRSSDNTTVVTVSRLAGSGILQGTTNLTAVNGVVTFTNLSHLVATNITLSFNSGSLTGAVSSQIAISPALANRLVFATQPSSATAGAPFGVQPAIKTQDPFGNDSTVGMGSSVNVTMTLSAGTGPLQGTTTLDIGTNAGNGWVSFSSLEIDSAGTNKQLTANAVGFSNAVSSVFAVTPAAGDHLTLLTQPSSSAIAGAVFAQQPVVRIEDTFGNLCSSDNSTMVTASRAAGSAALQGTTALRAVNGVISFTNLSYTVAETMNIGFSSGSLGGTVSSNVVVSAAAANRLTIATQPPATAIAGALFAPQPVVRVEDAYGNLRSGDNSTAVSAARSAGSGTLQGTTNLTAVNGLVAFTNLSHTVATNITITFTSGSLTSATSGTIAVSPAAGSRLTILTQPSASATAGVAFAQQPKLRIEDAFGNLIASDNSTVVTASRNAGSGNLQGTLVATAVNGVASFSNVSYLIAEAMTVGFSSGSLSSTTSSTVTVSAAAFVKLQLLTPGETAAPGTASGKTGTPSAQTAGIAFNVTVNAVDAQWNLVTNVTHTVGITSSDTNATLPANAALVSGTKAFSITLKTAGARTVSATDITDPTKTANSSPPVTVLAGSAASLAMLSQPGSTATAGVAFAFQPALRILDAWGNFVATDAGRTITAARGTGTGGLQGVLTATTSGGVAAFTNLSYTVAESMTINFTATGLTSATSGSVVVSPAAASQLAFATQPGGLSRTGSRLTTQPVVKSQDPFGNNSSLGLPASLNLSLALTSGSGSLLGATIMDIGTAAGNGTATFTNLQCTDAGTNKQLTASAPGLSNSASATFLVGGVDRAAGGSAIPSSSASGAFTALTGPTYYEAASGDVGTGTILLNAPSGFAFDTGGTAPTVLISRIGGTGADSLNINKAASGTAAAISTITTTQIKFSVSFASSSGVTDSLTFQNVRVRPTASSPLASGNLTNSGSAVMAAVTNSSTSFGQLIEVGPAARLAIQTQPPSTAKAGVAFAQQPVIRIEDSLGNLITSANGTVVTAARSAGSGTLQGNLTAVAASGVATFTNLFHTVATNITLGFTSSSLTSTTSTSIAVGPTAASQLVFVTQPANGTVGTPLPTQPAIRSRDLYGNNSAVGLGASKIVSLSLTSGLGPLLGTTSLDLGTNAGNGLIAFTNLAIGSTGTNQQLTASASGLVAAVSGLFSVAKAAQTITFTPLADKIIGDPPFSVNATSSSGLPVSYSILSGPATISGNVVTITGVGPVTVQASQAGDANCNPATNVSQNFNVAKANQTISFGPLANKTYGDAPFSVNATSSSGLPVSYSILSGPATISGNVVTITGVGTVIVQASQAGDANWNAATNVNQSCNVAKANQTISFNPLANKTYGDAPFSVNATSSSGLPISYSVFSGPATISGNMVTITGAGMVTVKASQAGDANWNAATNVNQSCNVTRAILTVTADNKSRCYGTTNPPFTCSYSGFVQGDDASVLSGTASLSTTATSTSPVAGGPYPITASAGTLQAANYNCVFAQGQLTITPAASSLSIASSANPSPTGSNATFTATISAAPPGAGVATGVAQFKVDGTPLGQAANLNNGIASLTSSSLSHGYHVITVEYAGDGNVLGCTNGLTGSQLIDTAPRALLASYGRYSGASLQIPIPDLLTNYTSDADGDATMLVSVGWGTNGASIFISGNSIWYQPSVSNPNQHLPDQFDYVVSDGYFGGLATNCLRISVVGPSPASQPPVLTSIQRAGAAFIVRFTGIPGYSYHLERAPALRGQAAVWTDLGSITTDGSGNAQFTDAAPPAGAAFYRAVWR